MWTVTFADYIFLCHHFLGMLLVLAVIQKSLHDVYFQMKPEMFENFRFHFFFVFSL